MTAKILAWYAQGLTIKQIAFFLGYAHSSQVTKCLQRAGLLPTQQKEPQ